jgi:hypothetical protein
MDQEKELEVLNEQLLNTYGKSLDGHPRFRVVYSDGEIEKRKGDFDIFDDSGNYLGTQFKTVREVLKYPLNRNRFILERYVLEAYGKWPGNPPPIGIFGYNGYEPFYVFEWVEEKPVPPFAALYFIIQNAMFNEISVVEYLKKAQEEKDERYIKKALDILDEASPYLVGLLHDGEAVLNAGTNGSGDKNE